MGGCPTSTVLIRQNLTLIAAEKYLSVEGDAAADASFIEEWLKKYNRLSSAVYLLGENYGTIRNLAVAEVLLSRTNKIHFEQTKCHGNRFGIRGIII